MGVRSRAADLGVRATQVVRYELSRSTGSPLARRARIGRRRRPGAAGDPSPGTPAAPARAGRGSVSPRRPPPATARARDRAALRGARVERRRRREPLPAGAPGRREGLAAAGVEHGEHGVPGAPPRPPAASVSSVETATSSAPVAWASERAVATPIRSPVKVPGPTPAPIRSTSPQPSAASASSSSQRASRRCAWRGPFAGRRIIAACQHLARREAKTRDGRRRRRVEGQQSAHVVRSIVISRSSGPRCSSRTRAAIRAPRSWIAVGVRPLDEGHPVGADLLLEQRRVLVVRPGQAVEVEVRDRDAAVLVTTRDRERGARHGPAHAERAAGPAHERRLARAELPGHQHDVTWPEIGGELRGDPLGLLRCAAGGHRSRRGRAVLRAAPRQRALRFPASLRPRRRRRPRPRQPRRRRRPA